MHKKILAGMLAACLMIALFAFVGCGSPAKTQEKEKFDISGEAAQGNIIGAMGTEVSLEPKGIKNILLIGDDEWGEYKPGHADMMLLLKVDFDTNTLYEITIPRDTRWQFSEDTAGKLNYVYTGEGSAAQARAASEIVGEPIDFYVTINFEGLKDIVDHFGGLKVDLPYDIEYSFYTNDYPNEVFEAGEQTLTPWRAMAIARARTGYGDDASQDYIRQYVVRQMFTSLMQAAFTNPGGIQPLFAALQGDIETNIPFDAQVNWAQTLSSAGTITVFGVSGPYQGGIDETAQDQWVVTPDPDGWAAIMSAIKNGSSIEQAVKTSFANFALTAELPIVTETVITPTK